MNDRPSRAYFLADAHLGASYRHSPEREEMLERFLKGIRGKASHLFIVGDLFDFWFEYKYLVPKGHLGVLSALRELSLSGVELHYLAGNHDFGLGNFLTDQAKVKIHWEPLKREFQGKRLYVAHGDGLNKRDYGYRMLKPILRSPINQWLYKRLPADWAIALALICSNKSRTKYGPEKIKRIRDDHRKIGEALLSQGQDIVVLGHTHKADRVETASGVYLNVGAWNREYPYAVMEDGEIALRSFFEEVKLGVEKDQ